MAIARTDITNDQWYLIGDNVSSITFQCASTAPIQVAITTNSSQPDLDSPGLIYNRFEGELKRNLVDLTYLSLPTHVWVKPLSSNATVIYDS